MEKLKNNRKKLIIIFGIIILPLIYSLFYLKGFWDPYNSLNNVPVALVNLDQCEKNCKGEELIKTLQEKDVFDFKIVSEDKADKGLINKDYYATIKIPANFTKSLESAASKERQQTTITYMPNTKTSYLASQIIGTAVKEVEMSLQSQVTKEIVGTLTDNLQSVPNQTKQISNALGTIYNGTITLNNGTNTLKKGALTLNNSYKEFDEGVNKLNEGSKTLYTSYQTLNSGINKSYQGVKQLKDKTNNLPELSEGITELKQGSNALNDSLTQYKDNSDNMVDNANKVYQTIINYYEFNPSVQSDPNLQAAYMIAKRYTTADATGYTGLQQIKMGTSALALGSGKINVGINTLHNQTASINELKQGIDSLEVALNKINQGSLNVLTGINNLNNGLNSLNINSNKINTGINTLSEGANTLNNGTGELEKGVGTAKKEVQQKIKETSSSTDELDGLADYAAKPIKVNEEDYGDVKIYGTYFSPYFMSLSLWIGGVLILMGLYYDPDHRFKVLGRNSENRSKRLILYNVIGILQAIILGFILKLVLNFEVTNIWLYYGSCILISEAFLAIIMFLFFNFKDVGKFLALVFLVLQLAACGGTFPVETEPSIYQALYPFMPMTYSVDLLRESFVSINSTLLIKDISVLIGILILFNALTLITSILKNKKEITTENNNKTYKKQKRKK